MIKYPELIELIDGEETGIAKGYSMCHLQAEVRSVEYFESLIKRDLKMFEEIQVGLLNISEPREGEWVEYEDGEFARISNIRDQLQLSNKIGVYVSGSGSSQASGCIWDYELDRIEQSRLAVENLIPTSSTKKGRCWSFSEKNAGRDRGVYFEIDFKVWKLKK